MHTYIKLCIPLVTILLLAACRPITNTLTSQQDVAAATASETIAGVDEAAPASPPAQPITDTKGSQAPVPTGGSVSEQDMALYKGRSIYGETYPGYTVSYDPKVWQLVAHEQDETLQHNELSSCGVRLTAGAIGAFASTNVALGDYSWDVAEVQPDGLLYSIPYENLAYFFGILLPPDAGESERAQCRAAAEQVISTFALLP